MTQPNPLQARFDPLYQASRQHTDVPWPLRQQRLQQLARMVREHRHAIADAIHADFGNRSRHETDLLEIFPTLAGIRHALKHGKQWMQPRKVATDWWFWPAHNRILPQPLGVVGIIAPWNYPLFLTTGPLIAALVAGNRALVKTSEHAPAFGQWLAHTVPQYFADNELAWAGPGDDAKSRYALAYGTLRMTTDVPAKRAFLKQLRDKYRNEDGLSKAWGIQLAGWELMEDPGFEPPVPNPEHPEIEADFQYFQKTFADAYFKTISDALKWHAPNQLLLGGRYAVSTPEAVASCAQYCDVLSFNMYTLKPQDGYDFAALRGLDKPVLISEFNFGSTDRGPFWGGLTPLAREEARGPAYATFLKQAMAEPSIVGVHWFQYLDQPVTGRLLDGENGHFGLVGITDVPFQGFVDSVRKSNLAAIQQLGYAKTVWR